MSDSGQPGAVRSRESRGLRLPGSRKVANPEARMPLMEHIRELRNRVLKALLAMTVGSVAGWFLYPFVWHFIKTPATARINIS